MINKTTTDSQFHLSKPKSFLRSLWRAAIGRYDVLLASLIINLLVLALPLVILQVYDRILSGESTDTFAFLIVGLCVVILIDGILRWIRSRIVSWSGARFEHATMCRAVDRLLGSRIEEFEQWPAGTHLDRLAAIESLREFHSGQGLVILSELPFVFLFLGLIALISTPVVMAPLVVIVIAGLIAWIIGDRLELAYRQRTELDDKRYNFVFQVLSSIHTVKGLGLENQMVRQYQSHLAPLTYAVKKAAYYASLGQSLGTTLGNAAMISVAAVGSLYVIDGSITGGSLLACTLLAGRAVQPIIRMIGTWVQS
jgi:ATP-binding cassette, subfamily C, bacterial LapB